jgi:DNA-binding transcriptional ArsR family regulator
MNAYSVSRIAALIGEAGRIRMLTAMLDGHSHTASQLAGAAAVSPQTASSHLAKLLAGRLISCERSGRQRLYRLKSADVAAAIEALEALAPAPANAPLPEIRFARSCYDHLAGVLAVAIRNELLRRDVLRQDHDAFVVTAKGTQFLRRFDIDVDQLRRLRRKFAPPCLDWTERHHHVAGALGSALLSRFLEMNWLARIRQSRALRITHAGERELEQAFGIRCNALRTGMGRRAA